MAIAKQDFYEGAALRLLARAGGIFGIVIVPPFYIFNDRLAVLLKYSTKGRSPWGFTLTENEQTCLHAKSKEIDTAIGLICGADGVVHLSYERFKCVAGDCRGPVHISCYRNHGEHYEVGGPVGFLPTKIAPSSWSKICDMVG
jgi:hypothetical protein